MVDFLSCQEAKPIHINLAYKNTTEMTQISLQDSSWLMSLEIPARKTVIQSARQSHAKAAGPLQDEGRETCWQPANLCCLLCGNTLLVQLLHAEAQDRNSHT